MVLQTPYFLFGLFAIAIPVIIHLVQLRKPQRVLFTNVAFIRQVEKITSNQRRLKHWLILISRILFLIFLVLVFCQPFIPAADNNFSKSQKIKAYIDNSGSMQNVAETGGVSLLEKAIDEMTRISKNFPEQAGIHLLDNAFKTGSGQNLNKRNLNPALHDISFSPANRQTGVILSRLSPDATRDQEQIFWFSDFQKSSFDPGFLSKNDSVSEINLVKLTPEAVNNVFIDSVALEDELVRINENNRLLVKVFNLGAVKKSNISIKLFIGNRQAATTAVTIEANGSANAQLDFRLTDSKLQQGRIEVEDQPVTFDNVYYFTLQPATAIRILDISNAALANTSRLFSNEPIFQYQLQNAGSVNSRSIMQADVVLLNEVASLDAALQDNLKKYVKDGGNLILIPNQKTSVAVYSKMFNDLGLPVKVSSDTAVSQLALPDIKNPFFRNIFSSLDKRLQMPRTPKVLTWPRADADLLVFKNGSNFLSQFNSGKGKIYVFAAPFSAENNEFSRNALFVPVMYKLALSSHAAAQQLAYNFSQRTFSLPVPAVDVRKNVFSLDKDSLKFIPEQQLRNGKMYFTVPSEMVEAGFYALKHSDSTLATLAFNYPKSESYLDTYSAEELRQLMPNKNVKIFEAGANASFSEQFIRDTQGTSLWQYCLLLSLIFLLVEILLIRFL
ncbi:BatA domain-containing protein [Adhaeribacter terrigena]|uniref:BatA domain-containing protein n=1 Tax=Adhaeribacter terrigena TaxID=2793070 RepID=UPI001F2CE53A|nr:BatA domain-containing protein [Adhaeribacter terrigena]